MNYIEPQKDKSFFTCPHCNTVSYMEYAKRKHPTPILAV